MGKHIIDLRTKELSEQTITSFTEWDSTTVCKTKKRFIDEGLDRIDAFLSSAIKPININDVDFVFTHITSSSNQCMSIRKYGLQSLVAAYNNTSSELRIFLDAHGIDIRIDYQCVKYKEEYYSIEYDPYDCPLEWEKTAYAGWLVGRKFQFDSGVCGFLAYDNAQSYLGGIHQCPEILRDIDRLLKTDLATEWQNICEPYAITCKVPASFLELNEDNSDFKYNIQKYLKKALCVATGGTSSEEIIQCKPSVTVEPMMITSIDSFKCWQ